MLNYWYGVYSLLENCVWVCIVWECDRAPTQGRGGRKEGKWSLIRIFFFSHTVSKFFHFGFFVGSQGYSNVLEIWNFPTGRERMKYLADAFLRKWQMHESTGGSRGLSVHVTRALCTGCTFAVLVQHFMAISVNHQIIQIGREFHRMSGPASF